MNYGPVVGCIPETRFRNWAEQNNCDMSDIDMNKYTIQEIQSSKLMTKSQQKFDITCKREWTGDSID